MTGSSSWQESSSITVLLMKSEEYLAVEYAENLLYDSSGCRHQEIPHILIAGSSFKEG